MPALWPSEGQEARTLAGGQSDPTPGPAPRARSDCQSLAHASMATDRKRAPHHHRFAGGSPSGHRQTHQSCGMKNSSRLESKLDDCIAKKEPKQSSSFALFVSLRFKNTTLKICTP